MSGGEAGTVTRLRVAPQRPESARRSTTYQPEPLVAAEVLAGLPENLRLEPGFVRLLDYARRIELYVPAYRDEVTVPAYLKRKEVESFLAGWTIEEVAHGEVLSAIVTHADPGLPDANAMAAADVSRLRAEHLNIRRRNRQFAALAPGTFLAAHMTMGVLNEWLTQYSYFALASVSPDPTVAGALRSIAKQEAKHASFYRQCAESQLRRSTVARRFVRWYLTSGRWEPAGGSIHADADTAAFVRFLVDTSDDISADANRFDLRLQTMPGLAGVTPVANFVSRNLGRPL